MHYLDVFNNTILVVSRKAEKKPKWKPFSTDEIGCWLRSTNNRLAKDRGK
jgi:hypothetical protein